ncbi:hypothetical protein [Rhizobium lusitanum]|uniref:hypothetical protein n=1 Tax=Rhizobium lusitanum TaxID=293958 RepID=UPI00195C243E|nr:hypothetical protein [Rhizobium lusitanum]MBM7046157.1 hypothetical protein [Rhizobium lusitanum]
MKTQQRAFVVEIKSTRRRSKMPPKSIWGDTDFKALVREAEASHLFKHDTVADASRQDEGRASNVEPQEEPVDIDVGNEQQVQASLIEADQSCSQQQDGRSTFGAVSQKEMDPPKRPSRRGGGRRRDTRIGPSVNGESNASTALMPVDYSDASYDELTSLEEENRRLKLLLAKQLCQQNLQLRKMLERFAIT